MKFLDLFYRNMVIKIFYVNLLNGKVTLINTTKFSQKFVMLYVTITYRIVLTKPQILLQFFKQKALEICIFFPQTIMIR